LAEREEGAWKPPIVLTTASDGGGVDEVAQKIDEHRAWMEGSGELDRRRTRRVRDEIETIAVTSLRRRFAHLSGHAELDTLARDVLAGTTDPFSAADVLIESL
ncbi:MAG: methylmalonyl Co-A mutase-associated GTPase MeaB, partial [Streptosporangiaceae bacterium]